MSARHSCHWPGCTTPVPPSMWGCKAHWFKLTKALRDRIWSTYRPGQELTKTPSCAYLEAAKAVQVWIAEQERGRHEFDSDAVCVRCGFDGAEWHHLKTHTHEDDASDEGEPLCTGPAGGRAVP